MIANNDVIFSGFRFGDVVLTEAGNQAPAARMTIAVGSGERPRPVRRRLRDALSGRAASG
ncbi:MAG: hypothetical protein RML12_06310 [Xanthomonadales bacterium]|nr:hypothetical protein [Xanthomonadales bacterium]